LIDLVDQYVAEGSIAEHGEENLGPSSGEAEQGMGAPSRSPPPNVMSIGDQGKSAARLVQQRLNAVVETRIAETLAQLLPRGVDANEVCDNMTLLTHAIDAEGRDGTLQSGEPLTAYRRCGPGLRR
jgi:hypothetical protein